MTDLGGRNVGVGGCLPGDKGPVTGRYICRDRGETAGRYTFEGAKRSCVTRKRGKSGRKGAIFEKRGKFEGTKVALKQVISEGAPGPKPLKIPKARGPSPLEPPR